MKCYAAYAKDIDVRNNGSSGGVYPRLSEQMLKREGIVYASVYNDDFSVSFDRVDNTLGLKKTFTSKYMQSNSLHIFEKVETDLIHDRQVLFCGTPCQVSGLINYLTVRRIDTQNLLTIDFICHGVPSRVLFDKFLKSYTPKRIISLNMRNKENGWNWGKFSWEFRFEDGSRKLVKQSEVPYMKAFLSDSFLRPSCYRCMSKRKTKADITIGDFWGITYTGIRLDDRYGVSGVIINSSKGEREFQEASDLLDFWEVDYSDIIKYNPSLEQSTLKPLKRITAYKKLNNAKDVNKFLCSMSNDSFPDKAGRKVYQALPFRKTNLKIINKNEKYCQLINDKKEDCCGCLACVSVCPKSAITTRCDNEGFCYPVIDTRYCVKCNLCSKVCPQVN